MEEKVVLSEGSGIGGVELMRKRERRQSLYIMNASCQLFVLENLDLQRMTSEQTRIMEYEQ